MLTFFEGKYLMFTVIMVDRWRMERYKWKKIKSKIWDEWYDKKI